MRQKVVPLNKQSKRQQREHRNANRVYFGHQQCPVVHKSDADYNRKRTHEYLLELEQMDEWDDIDEYDFN